MSVNDKKWPKQPLKNVFLIDPLKIHQIHEKTIWIKTNSGLNQIVEKYQIKTSFN